MTPNRSGRRLANWNAGPGSVRTTALGLERVHSTRNQPHQLHRLVARVHLPRPAPSPALVLHILWPIAPSTDQTQASNELANFSLSFATQPAELIIFAIVSGKEANLKIYSRTIQQMIYDSKRNLQDDSGRMREEASSTHKTRAQAKKKDQR